MKISAKLLRKIMLAALGIILVSAFFWVATHSGPLAPIKITVTKVTKGEITPALFGIGTVEARHDYLIGPTVAGRVRRVLVDVGDSVKAGQLLAEMDPIDLDERVSSTVAAVSRGRSLVATAEAQVQEVKNRRELAIIEARRYSQLGKQGFVSKSVVDAKLLEQKTVEAQLAAAEAGLNAARKDMGRLEADREGLKQQRDNVRLIAPTDGVITARDAEPGTTVIAGQPVLKLIEPSSLWIKVRFDQARSTGLRTDLPAEIELRSQRNISLSGKVVRMELLSDSVTEERMVHVAFNQLPKDVAVGEMADIQLKLPAIQDVLIIPNASLRLNGTQRGVWIHDNGDLRFTAVKTGSESPNGQIEVLEGLEAGDEIVVYSEQEIKEGSNLNIVKSIAGKAK